MPLHPGAASCRTLPVSWALSSLRHYLTHTVHPACAHPTLCSILLWTLIENAEPQQAVPLRQRDVSSYSGFSLGPARKKRPLSPHARLPGAASPAPRPPFPQAHFFPPYFQSPAPGPPHPSAGQVAPGAPPWGSRGREKKEGEDERDRGSQLRAFHTPQSPPSTGLAFPSESPQLCFSPRAEQRRIRAAGPSGEAREGATLERKLGPKSLI